MLITATYLPISPHIIPVRCSTVAAVYILSRDLSSPFAVISSPIRKDAGWNRTGLLTIAIGRKLMLHEIAMPDESQSSSPPRGGIISYL